jgi:predicted DNA-binding transcriptional regulator AlpA
MDVLLTRADLREHGIRISNSTLLRMEAKGKFPKRRYLTPHTVVWHREEIDEFLSSLFTNNEEQEGS